MEAGAAGLNAGWGMVVQRAMKPPQLPRSSLETPTFRIYDAFIHRTVHP